MLALSRRTTGREASAAGTSRTNSIPGLDSPDVDERGTGTSDQEGREHELPVVGPLVSEREQERSTSGHSAPDEQSPPKRELVEGESTTDEHGRTSCNSNGEAEEREQAMGKVRQA